MNRRWLILLGAVVGVIGVLAALFLFTTGRRMAPSAVADMEPDNKEGGTGTRAKGDEGSMGNPNNRQRYGVMGPAASAAMAPMATAPAPADIPAAAEAPIDPNGRFATTYRPGGGHLAAFEGAVARGIVPAPEREVVSDIGSRFWPTIEEPKNKALVVQADLERGKIPPSGGPLHVRLALRSSSKPTEGRARLSVHLIMDISGSMAGEPIKYARQAASVLVDKLLPTDDFSLVTFSTEGRVEVKDGPVGTRKEMIQKTISGIKDEGGTNIGEGLRLAYLEANTPTIPKDAVKVVFLLSDGQANSGITNRSQLAKLALDAFQEGIQTSTFGLGTSYDGALMSAIASDGAGGYYYLSTGDQIGAALTTELEKRLDPAASAVEIRVRLKEDVGLLRVYGSRRLSQQEAATVRTIEQAVDSQTEKRDKIKRDRENDTEGGMRFFIPAFARSDSHAMLLKLNLPKGVGSRQIAVLEVKYKDRVTKKNFIEEMQIKVDYANSDEDSGKTQNASVMRTVQGFAAGEVLMDAASAIARGDRSGAVAMMTEREQLLRQAAQTLNEPEFTKDADRLARLRGHMGQTGGLGEPLVLSMMLETAGRSHLH